MASITCDICFEAFSEVERVPKMLDCGHTFCSVCLQALSSQICPTCKSTLTKSADEYATNFIVLKLKTLETEKYCPGSQIAGSLKKMKELYLSRKEMILKNIRKRTDLKNIIINDLTKIQQMLEMDPDVLDSTDEEKISELETNLAKVDEVLFCCENTDVKPTYQLRKYKNSTCFLYNLVNRLHEGEEIYAFERVNGKPKYGRVSLNMDMIDFHVLDLPKVDKLSSIVPMQDVKKCIRKDNFQTFIKIGNETLRFSIINSSFLTFMFIKLCTGETGRMMKGITASFQWQHVQQVNSPCYNRYYETTMQSTNYTSEFQNILIEKLMLNDVEVDGLDEYDLTVFEATIKDTFCEGDFVLRMLEKGVCNIVKLSGISDLTDKYVVAKMIEPFPAGFQNVQTGAITDSGISLMF